MIWGPKIPLSHLALHSPISLDPEGAIQNRGMSLLPPVKVSYPGVEAWPLSLMIDNETLYF